MLFKKIRMFNFLPYYDLNEIDFPQETSRNITIFYGENTKGKTSLLNAFRWVLYGIAESKGKVLQYKDLLNKEAFKNGVDNFYVELEFESSGNDYFLKREMNKNTDSSSGTLLIRKNGSPITYDDGIKEIEKIAPSGTKRFFLFDGELLREYEQLMEPSSGNAKKIKKAIEDVMGIPSLTRTLDILDQVEKRLKKEASQEKTSNIALEKVKEKNRTIDEAISSNNSELERLNGSRDEIEKNLKSVSRIIETSEENIDKFNELKKLEEKRNTLDALCSGVQEDVNIQKRDLWKSLILENLSKKIKDANRIEDDRKKLFEDHIILKHRIESLENSSGIDICPTCNQEVQRSNIDFDEEVHKLKSKYREIKLKLDSMPNVSALIEANTKFADCPRIKDYCKLEESLVGNLEDKRVIEKTIRELKSELADFDGEGIHKKIRQKVNYEIQLADLEEAINGIEDVIRSQKTESRKLSDQIVKLSGTDAARAEITLNRAKRLSEIFESSKNILREQIKKRVEVEAQSAFQKMTSRPDDYVGLRITDSYGLEIISRDGSVVPERSAGAEQVVALALIDGLNRVGKSPGPVIMDTPFGRLDETHRSKILAYMPTSARQFMVFVHSGELKQDSIALDSIRDRIGREYTIRSRSAYVSFME